MHVLKLTTESVEDFCTAWRKGMYRVCDQNVSLYGISEPSKKCYWASFRTRSCRIPGYCSEQLRRVMMKIWIDWAFRAMFQSSVVNTYLKCYNQLRPTLGRIIRPARRRLVSTLKRCGICHKNTRKGRHKCDDKMEKLPLVLHIFYNK